MDTIWKQVKGFEGKYEVSNLGDVRSITRRFKVAIKGGEYSTTRKGRILRAGGSKSGHLSVVLGRGNTKSVHALVLTAFVGDRPKGMDTRHKDGNPANNKLSNLHWGTRADNIRDKKWHGNPLKLSPEGIREMRRLRESGHKLSTLAEKFGVNISTVSSTCNYISHKDVV